MADKSSESFSECVLIEKSLFEFIHSTGDAAALLYRDRLRRIASLQNYHVLAL
jgi:hypothetical protein